MKERKKVELTWWGMDTFDNYWHEKRKSQEPITLLIGLLGFLYFAYLLSLFLVGIIAVNVYWLFGVDAYIKPAKKR